MISQGLDILSTSFAFQLRCVLVDFFFFTFSFLIELCVFLTCKEMERQINLCNLKKNSIIGPSLDSTLFTWFWALFWLMMEPQSDRVFIFKVTLVLESTHSLTHWVDLWMVLRQCVKGQYPPHGRLAAVVTASLSLG